MNHIDCFVSEGRGTESVAEVKSLLTPFAFNVHDNEVWDNSGQAIGHLQAHGKLHIMYTPCDDFEKLISDSEIRACILTHVRQKITLLTDTPNVPARAIRGHSTNTRFEDSNRYGIVYSSRIESWLSVRLQLSKNMKTRVSAPPERTRPQGS